MCRNQKYGLTMRKQQAHESLLLSFSSNKSVREAWARWFFSRRYSLEKDDLMYSFMDDALEMIWSFDEQGIIRSANKAACEQLAYGDAIQGVHISEIYPGDFLNEGRGVDTTVSLDGDLINLMAYRKNRTCFLTEARIVPDCRQTGHYVCFARDLSRQEFLEKELAEMEKKVGQEGQVKSEFVANVTHELRTPVNGILGSIRELQGMEADGSKKRILQMIERSCRDMNGIISNILDFSKLEAGKFMLEPRRFHFRSMIDYIKANHIGKITEKGLDFFVTVSPDIPEYIHADELRIVQILNNLLSNACKFTAVGKVSLEVLQTTRTDNRVELFFMVLDTGIGIDKEDRDKLFKSFSQVDASISRRFGGTGLGLNICKQLVELMGGSINVDSRKNKGTMFSFSILVEVPEGETESIPVDPQISTFVMKSQEPQKEESAKEMVVFGTPENLAAIRKRMLKLILSVEMDNWEKAEMFTGALRQLTEEAPREIKMAMLKLKLAVQKEDYKKTAAAHEVLMTLLEL